MADVTLKYKGATIGELSESGSKTIETAGKYCEADILLEYVKSGGGMIQKTGTFTLASDYTYATSLANGYSGSILVNTGLSKINSILLYTEEWLDKTLSANGVGCYFAINETIPVVASKTGPAGYYLSYGVFKANANFYYPYVDIGGIVLNAACPNDVPAGSFGFQCRSNAYPIKAGTTVHWKAIGEE